MNIEFVNHASFIVEHKGIRMISDPWLFGSAFHNGWDLLCNYDYDFSKFSDITHIWFSHEHPDHFSPAVLKKIDPEHRKEITVLFQETKDGKVIKFCKGLGFKTQELKNHSKVELIPGFSVQCGKVLYFDSWLCLYLDDKKILNINDCMVDGDIKAADVKKHTGEVDLLFTQFSYSAWKGAPEDKHIRIASAKSKLEVMKTQMQALAPVYTIPFASFIYFSHEENKYLNDAINKPPQAAQAIKEGGSIPIVLYPGDNWEFGSAWDNSIAIDKYESDYNQIANKKFHSAEKSLTEEELTSASRAYVSKLKKNNNFFLVRMLKALGLYGFFKPFDVYIYDQDKGYTFDIINGLVRNADKNNYDVRMHSEALDYVFKFDWGYDTLTVNGRFEASLDGFAKMSKNLGIGPLNNTGRKIGLSLLADTEIIGKFMDHLGGFTKRMKKLNKEA